MSGSEQPADGGGSSKPAAQRQGGSGYAELPGHFHDGLGRGVATTFLFGGYPTFPPTSKPTGGCAGTDGSAGGAAQLSKGSSGPCCSPRAARHVLRAAASAGRRTEPSTSSRAPCPLGVALTVNALRLSRPRAGARKPKQQQQQQPARLADIGATEDEIKRRAAEEQAVKSANERANQVR
eukprot:jgi/Chrpa1/9200/Chrysochromulina_OHIO_Genome00011952-RA